MPERMLTVICSDPVTGRLAKTLDVALNGRRAEMLTQLDENLPLHNRRILFAVALDETGIGLGMCRLLAQLRSFQGYLEGSVAGVLVDSTGERYTKSVGRELVLSANAAGCLFPGRPLVEAIESLRNFTVQAKNARCTLEEAYQLAADDLIDRVLSFELPQHAQPKVVVLHASNYSTSNTMALWSRIKEVLARDCDIIEIGLRNGTMEDCSGCPYTMCLHFGEKGECFYGGVMVQDVYPAIREADALVMLCPNYNDALSANLTACINRLTALYRTTSFDRKALFGIVVSGYSGGDIVAAQLVSALCMNKGFWLPPDFCLMETANDPGSALKLPGIGARIERFGSQMRRCLCGEKGLTK